VSAQTAGPVVTDAVAVLPTMTIMLAAASSMRAGTPATM
jgi:hypothetical protein